MVAKYGGKLGSLSKKSLNQVWKDGKESRKKQTAARTFSSKVTTIEGKLKDWKSTNVIVDPGYTRSLINLKFV